MRKMFTKNLFTLRFFICAGVLSAGILLANTGFSQSYFTLLSDVTGKYTATSPTGCNAPAITNPTAFADVNDNNYSSIVANIAQPLTCSDSYKMGAYLNLPVDSPYLSAGMLAGFRIRAPYSITRDNLGKYVTLNSYLNGQLQESVTGKLLMGINADQLGINWVIYFASTKNFNYLEIVVSPEIVPTNTQFEFDVFYGIGTKNSVLPAEIDNFKLNTSGRNVNLSWQSLTETNVANYRIERSSNGGASYTAVGTLAAKGNSNIAISYAYTDNVSVDGSYLYRLVTVNKDGSTKATSSITAVISGQGNLFLYPSVVKAGQNVIIRTSQSGNITALMYDAQGRLVKQQRSNAAGTFNLYTTGLSAGVYNIKVISQTGSVLQSKIVVN